MVTETNTLYVMNHSSSSSEDLDRLIKATTLDYPISGSFMFDL